MGSQRWQGGERFLGIDAGAETLKVVEVTVSGEKLSITRQTFEEHHKEPGKVLLRALSDWDLSRVAGARVTGRLSRGVALPRVPIQQAQAHGLRHRHPDRPATLVTIGSHGFSVLELRSTGMEVYRENSRCSQGTGNFLRQLVERFDLSIEEASVECAEVDDPAALSGRCPVILKTDMTHLANTGVARRRILAGLFDAVAENVQVLLQPRVSPPLLVLSGGVTRSPRIREHFRRFAERRGMELAPDGDPCFLEALGCALLAAEEPSALPSLEDLTRELPPSRLDRVPPLRSHLDRVRRLPPAPSPSTPPERWILGYDIGSTGAKLVALEPRTGHPGWQAYEQTLGDPVGASHRLTARFLGGPAGDLPVVSVGVTGSGREIVGSLLSSCFGPERIYILNEIAAHAEGALRADPRVDTIFEIGGQDAKYIRLMDGRVVDAAMNEACSAGTGSFIEEQGRRFPGIEDVVRLGEVALEAESGISLGQHCSVFMAEIIDEAVAQGIPAPSIIAGIYDAIIQNYLNRVKGSRSVGEVIFCQGMPFSADALAAAVARQTGSEVIVPPHPGLTGALGIALLAEQNLSLRPEEEALDMPRYLTARVKLRDTFVCRSRQGCGGSGNKCRINRVRTVVDGERATFTWGGGCSLYDRATSRVSLPDRTPDPFRERDARVAALVQEVTRNRGRPTVGLTDEFLLKTHFPFFARFFHALGFDCRVRTGADQAALKRGIEEANVPFCAPMQQYHGLISMLAEDEPDYLFLPMWRTLPRVRDEEHAVLCPMVQGSPDVTRWDLGDLSPTVLTPVIDVGPEGLARGAFQRSCEALALMLGREDRADWLPAFERALEEQRQFEQYCLSLGERALHYCESHPEVVPVVVLGRPYTIYNQVLNSNVPHILREQGALAIPVDCFPVDRKAPLFDRAYWGYAQRNLRAAWQIRRTEGLWSLWCSNYACGPDSFGLHFYAYLMEGKPFAVIETDGHSGDAGTRTRVEAFLYCARQERDHAAGSAPPNRLRDRERDRGSLPRVRSRGDTVLIPRMGPGAEPAAALIRGLGVPAEALPMPDHDALSRGRRHTSGKECVPMAITLGSLLQRLEREEDPHRTFTFLMPQANGPCRFGSYNLLHKIVLERLGWKDRVAVWSPADNDYFQDFPPGAAALAFASFMAMDLLLEARYHTRPVETRPGASEAIYQGYSHRLIEHTEQRARGDLSLSNLLQNLATDELYGFRDLLRDAARDFAAVRGDGDPPTVLVVGEIYVRCDPFANGFVIEELERRGLRVRFAPFNEWLEYTDKLYRGRPGPDRLSRRISGAVQDWIRHRTTQLVAQPLGWPRRTTVEQSLAASEDYLRTALAGEAVLTVGGPVHEWREGHIQGVVSVGPLECMPSKLAEAQLFHVAEEEHLPNLCLALNGDPVDPEALDNFAFEVHQLHRRHPSPSPVPAPRRQQVLEGLERRLLGPQPLFAVPQKLRLRREKRRRSA